MYQEDAIVLRSYDVREADRVLVLLTREHGKMPTVARGVRRAKSKLAGALQLFMSVQVLLTEGRGMAVIASATPHDIYRSLREDLVGLSAGSYLCELTDAFLPDLDPVPHMHRLLCEVLEALNRGAPVALAMRYYELALLDGLGYGPIFDRCAHCDAPLAGGASLDAAAGGAVCGACGRTGLLSLGAETLAWCERLRHGTLAELARFRPSRQAAAQLEDGLGALLVAQLDRPLLARAFLHEMLLPPAVR